VHPQVIEKVFEGYQLCIDFLKLLLESKAPFERGPNRPYVNMALIENDLPNLEEEDQEVHHRSLAKKTSVTL